MDHRESFQRKTYDLNVLDNFFSHFSIAFWFLPVFVFFQNGKTYYDVLLMT